MNGLSVAPDVLSTSFRRAMGQVAAAVSVVTVLDGPEPHGTTVSAFSSLSMEPPMMVLSLDRSSRLLSRLAAGARIGVNVLAAGQDDVALRFAGSSATRFRGIPWQPRDDAPALATSHAWIALDVARLVPAGDHVLVLGDVVASDVTDTAPLVYWRRTFGTHAAP